MKKKFILLSLFGIAIAQAQVGINNEEPKATLEVKSGSGNNNAKVEGLLIPRVSKNKALLMAASDTKPEESTMIYVNDLVTGFTAPTDGTESTVADITENGYYHWNGTKWVKNSGKDGELWAQRDNNGITETYLKPAGENKDVISYKSNRMIYTNLGEANEQDDVWSDLEIGLPPNEIPKLTLISSKVLPVESHIGTLNNALGGGYRFSTDLYLVENEHANSNNGTRRNLKSYLGNSTRMIVPKNVSSDYIKSIVGREITSALRANTNVGRVIGEEVEAVNGNLEATLGRVELLKGLSVKVKNYGTSVDVKGIEISNRDFGKIDNLYGIHFNPLNTGKLSNYGLYIEDVGNDTAKNNYSIYTGKGAVSFGDRVRIGSNNDVDLTTKTPAFMIEEVGKEEKKLSLIMDSNEIQARKGEEASLLMLQGNGGDVMFNAHNGVEAKKFAFYGNTGNISLGAGAPTQKLDVNGNARLRELPNVSGAATDKVVVVDNDGVLKTVERSSVGGSSTTYTAGTGISIENNVISTTKASVRVINSQSEEEEVIIKPSDNGGYIYVDISVGTGRVELPFSSDLPVGFSCVIVQKGDTGVEVVPRYRDSNGRIGRVILQTARGEATRARYSAIGVIKDTPSTVTVTGDAVGGPTNQE